MQTRRVHFDHVAKGRRVAEIWEYRVGRRFVRIISPARKSFDVEIGKVLAVDGGDHWVPPASVRAYIRRHLRRIRPLPECGAEVLFKRLLLSL